MIKAGLTVFTVVGMLFSVTSVADDEEISAVDGDNLPATHLTLPLPYSGIDSASRWQDAELLDTAPYSTEWSQPFANVRFEDSGTFARVSKIRSLSLLTFAEMGASRLFLGVNDEGLVGLHFRAFRRQDKDRHLEVVRMPYLEKIELETE